MEFSLRDFEERDFDTLWAMDQECFSPEIAYTKLELATYMAGSGSFTLVAQSDMRSMNGGAIGRSGLLGFIVGQFSPRHVGHIVTIDVIAEARRFGVGSCLLSAAERVLIANQCRAVQLETAVDNAPASAFYRKHGYAFKRTIANYYATGVHAMLMRKYLAPKLSETSGDNLLLA